MKKALTWIIKVVLAAFATAVAGAIVTPLTSKTAIGFSILQSPVD